MVKDLNIGDNVAYAGGIPNAYAEERILSAHLGVKIPDGISHKVAACIMTKGLTTHYLLCKTYKLTSNDVVLFHAAAGGVGQVVPDRIVYTPLSIGKGGALFKTGLFILVG